MSELENKYIKPATLNELSFEEKDFDLFYITDMKTKLLTVQKYFFLASRF